MSEATDFAIKRSQEIWRAAHEVAAVEFASITSGVSKQPSLAATFAGFALDCIAKDPRSALLDEAVAALKRNVKQLRYIATSVAEEETDDELYALASENEAVLARIKAMEKGGVSEWTPTRDAYEAACKALTHWRAEAQRLGGIAGEKPREMKGAPNV
jgi:hypothetical protein